MRRLERARRLKRDRLLRYSRALFLTFIIFRREFNVPSLFPFQFLFSLQFQVLFMIHSFLFLAFGHNSTSCKSLTQMLLLKAWVFFLWGWKELGGLQRGRLRWALIELDKRSLESFLHRMASAFLEDIRRQVWKRALALTCILRKNWEGWVNMDPIKYRLVFE